MPLSVQPSPSRFCDGTSGYAVLYAALSFETCIAETLFRDRFVRRTRRELPLAAILLTCARCHSTATRAALARFARFRLFGHRRTNGCGARPTLCGRSGVGSVDLPKPPGRGRCDLFLPAHGRGLAGSVRSGHRQVDGARRLRIDGQSFRHSSSRTEFVSSMSDDSVHNPRNGIASAARSHRPPRAVRRKPALPQPWAGAGSV